MKIIGKIPPWVLLCLVVFHTTAETAYTSALPSIASNLRISGNLVQLSSSVYFLGFSLGILLLGRVSDIFGRRPVVLSGMIVYIVALIASIFAINIEMLIVLRFISSFGASIGSVIGQAMARDSYEGRELSYIYAKLSMGLALIPSLGSVIGGYIVEYSGWRYIFIFLSSVAFLLLLLYLKYLPETNPYIGVARNNKYFTVLKVVIRDKIVLLYAFIVGAFNGMAFGFFIEAPFIFVKKLGMPPSLYGKLILLLSISIALGSLIATYLIRRHINSAKIMASGLVLSLVGSIILIISSYLIENLNKYFVVAMIFGPMMMHMVGHSLLLPMCLRYSLEDYSKVTGTAGSVFGSLYYLLVAVITFTVSKLHSDTITNFTLLFFALSAACSLSFYLIQKWHPLRKIYIFN
jgi:Bcr/CflA subfamily drug resistance transporter